jgi:hypothetical protein
VVRFRNNPVSGRKASAFAARNGSRYRRLGLFFAAGIDLSSTSALPPIANIGTQSRNVRFVPKADRLLLRLYVDLLLNDNRQGERKCGGWPSCDSTQIRPPCISMMRFDMASAKPAPPFLRVIALSACSNS